MADEQSGEKYCNLRLVLSRYAGVSSSYDAKGGLKRRFVLSGRIDDPYVSPSGDPSPFGEPGSAFHGKPVRVEISSSPDAEILGSIRASYMGGMGDPCGLVRCRSGVAPERFELDGEMVETEPVEVWMQLSPDAFEAIRRQAAEAYDNRRIMWAKVTLVGDSLPATDDPRMDSFFGLHLKDLDISADKVYGVRDFEIFDTRHFDRLRGRVLQVERGKDKGYGAYISILLTKARYEVHVERALVHSIACEGRVINGRGKPYDGADVTVEFWEHEPNRQDELPERALFGEFGYYPKLPAEENASNYFTFSLRYAPADARHLLIPLLSQEAGTQVVLTANLTVEDEELLAATNELRGTVRHYSFNVRRNLS